MTEKNNEREAFEAWMQRDKPDMPLYRRDMAGAERFGQYCSMLIEDQWQAWQARAALAQAGGQEPIYQLQKTDGSWIDQAEHSYRYNLSYGHAVRIVCAAPAPIASAQQAALQRLSVGNFTPETVKAIARGALVVTDAAPAPVAEPAALTDEFRKALIAAIVEHTDSSEIWAEGIITQALLAAQPAAEAPTCETCNGTRMVDDGEITGSGGIDFENGPIQCVKDCPDCAQPAADVRAEYDERGRHWQSHDDGLVSRVEPAHPDRQGVALSDEEIAAIFAKHTHGLPTTDRQRTVAIEIGRAILSRASSSRAEVERDAARYRLLRDSSSWPEEMDGADAAIVVGYAGGESLLSGEQLDSAIDAMLAAAEAPNGDRP